VFWGLAALGCCYLGFETMDSISYW